MFAGHNIVYLQMFLLLLLLLLLLPFWLIEEIEESAQTHKRVSASKEGHVTSVTFVNNSNKVSLRVCCCQPEW